VSKLPPELEHLTKDLPPDKAKDVEAAIVSSPYLVQQLKLAVQRDHGDVKSIVISHDPNEGGHFDTGDNTIHINAQAFQRKNKQELYDNLVTTIGHETGHAIMSGASYSANAHLQYAVQEAANRGVPSVDLTVPVSQYLAHTRTDEGFAEVMSMNALASRIEHTQGKFKENDFLRRMDVFTQCVEDNKLQPGIIMASDGRIAHDLNTPSFEAMKHCQYDLPASLGTHGDSNYRNYYGTHALEIISSELDDVRKGEIVPMVKLDLDRLGLSARQLERNGLDMDGQNLTIIDISGGKQKSVTFDSSTKGSKNNPDTEIESSIAQTPKVDPNSPASIETSTRAIDLLAPKEREVYEQSLTQANRLGLPEVETQNLAMAMTHRVTGNGLIKQIDDITVVRARADDGGDRLHMMFKPHGDRDPIFNDYVDLNQSIAKPASESAEQTRNLAITKEQEAREAAQTQSQNGPTMKIGGRTIGPADGDSSGGDGGGGE
jgi:hypothetical protein